MGFSRARACYAYPVAGAIGFAAFVAVYGFDHFVGTSGYWRMPQEDERMALMGYRYFVADTWHWPVFANDAINVPYDKSVAFLDCIPIWALIHKAIATVIPPWERFSAHAYLGLWHGLAYVLQPCFGVACLRTLGHRSWWTAIVAALVFVAIPTWIFRYSHPALSAHWILLWALYLYLRRARIGALLAQLAVAALVTPYLAAMSLPIACAAVLRMRDRRSMLVGIPAAFLVVAAASWFAGYFGAETARAQWGFEWESANLLGWLVPARSGIVGDARWIANVDANPWQYEGYAYLGAGVLLLLALELPHARAWRGTIARHRWLLVVALSAGILALSNRIFFGSHELVRIPLVPGLRSIAHQFRSPGRFVWIPTYVLVVFLLHRTFARATGVRGWTVAALAAVLQVVDATGDWAIQHANTRAPYYAALDQQAWRSLVHAHERVVILPPYSCVTGGRSFDLVSMEIQFLASERAIPINGTYSARDMRHCDAERDAWPTLEPEPGTLYVLLPEASVVVERFATRARCQGFAFGHVCY